MKRPDFFIFTFLMILAGCGPRNEQTGRTVFRYNEAAGITMLDPAFSRDQTIIWVANQLYNGLVQLDEKMVVRPCIAKSWEISPDGMEYTFHLRNDVLFHDNPVFKEGKRRTVISADFVYSFLRIMDPATASPGAWIFNWVSHDSLAPPFTALDDSTLMIRLNRPFPPFPGLLSMQYCSVIPKEAIDTYGPDFRKNPVGTGPFMYKTWEEGVKLVLVRNPGYFETDSAGNRLPYLDAVAITFVADKQSVFLEFIKGNLDFMSGIDPSYKDELLTNDGRLNEKYAGSVRLITQPYLNTEYLGFMVGKLPSPGLGPIPLKVRKAINMAFDRKKMIRYLRNNIGTPGFQGITPKGLPSFDSTIIYYDYDPPGAARLLAEAGFPGGKGLDPVVLTATSDYLDICKYIQREVQTLGIDLRIEVTPPATVKEMKAQAKLPFFRASWIADYPDAENYLSMFYSKNFCPQGPNYTHFSDMGYDRLYETSFLTRDDSVRYRMYREMEDILMAQSPVIVLYYDQVLRFTRSNITGIGSNPMNLLTLKSVRKKP